MSEIWVKYNGVLMLKKIAKRKGYKEKAEKKVIANKKFKVKLEDKTLKG